MYKKLFFILFISIISLEILLRLFVPLIQVGTKKNYTYDDEIGVKYKNNLRSVVLKDYIEESITNKYGSVNYQDNFNNYDKIIFAVGDSNTKGVGVQFDESYPFQMYLELNTGNIKDETSYGVVNLGIQASGTIAAFKIYDIYKSKIKKPNFVTHVGGMNDYSDDVFFESGKKHNSLVDGSPRLFGLAGYISTIIEYSEILKRMKLTYSIYNFKLAQNNKIENLKVKPNKFTLFKEGFDTKTSKLYLQFNEKSKEDDFIFILSWVDGRKDGNAWCKETYNYVKDWASKNNVLFADWCQDFKRVYKDLKEIPLVNNHSAGHYRSWINRIIANSFVKKILVIAK